MKIRAVLFVLFTALLFTNASIAEDKGISASTRPLLTYNDIKNSSLSLVGGYSVLTVYSDNRSAPDSTLISSILLARSFGATETEILEAVVLGYDFALSEGNILPLKADAVSLPKDIEGSVIFSVMAESQFPSSQSSFSAYVRHAVGGSFLISLLGRGVKNYVGMYQSVRADLLDPARDELRAVFIALVMRVGLDRAVEELNTAINALNLSPSKKVAFGKHFLSEVIVGLADEYSDEKLYKYAVSVRDRLGSYIRDMNENAEAILLLEELGELRSPLDDDALRFDILSTIAERIYFFQALEVALGGEPTGIEGRFFDFIYNNPEVSNAERPFSELGEIFGPLQMKWVMRELNFIRSRIPEALRKNLDWNKIFLDPSTADMREVVFRDVDDVPLKRKVQFQKDIASWIRAIESLPRGERLPDVPEKLSWIVVDGDDARAWFLEARIRAFNDLSFDGVNNPDEIVSKVVEFGERAGLMGFDRVDVMAETAKGLFEMGKEEKSEEDFISKLKTNPKILDDLTEQERDIWQRWIEHLGYIPISENGRRLIRKIEEKMDIRKFDIK